MEAIVCRSSAQIYEDNVCELHTRLTKWRRELRNAVCFDYRERERKTECLKRMDDLIARVERSIEHGGTFIEICTIERLGIAYAAMRLSV